MDIRAIKPEWMAVWNTLPFIGFSEKYFNQGKKEEHMHEAAKCLNLLLSGDVGLTAETAAGKTIIASLVILAGNYRTLFLTPRIHLTGQHRELFEKITGGTRKQRSICGDVPAEKRVWNDSEDLVIFATPHVVVQEFAKARVDFEKFDLVVFDEMHNASENYPFTTIARTAMLLRKTPKFLSLSATPGDNEEKVAEVENNLSIDHWLKADIKTPNSPTDCLLAEMDEPLLNIESIFLKLLRQAAEQLQRGGFDVDLDKIITWGELEWITKENNSLYGCSEFYKNILAIAKYRKLHYAYTVALTESYQTFLDYCYNKLSQDRSRSAMQILSDTEFRKIVSIAQNKIDSHPKIKMLIKILRGAPLRGKTGIIFVSEKRTGNHIRKLLAENGLRAETIYGGRGKKIKDKQDAALEKLKGGGIDCLISTSVIEEGFSVAEVGFVIHYSMPKTGISRRQRGGRTGRFEKGHILFIILNHAADTALYWSTARKSKRIDEIIAIKTGRKLPGQKTGKKRKKDELTLSLF